MSKSDAFENALLLHIFNNINIADIGNGAGLPPSGVPGDLYVALHTADPGEGGNQLTSEATYTSYARVPVSRLGAAGFTVTGNAVENTAVVAFPQCTGGSNNITHFSVGTLPAPSAGMILYSGALSAPLLVTNLVTPQFLAGQLDGSED
jgi:hypothetical protein